MSCVAPACSDARPDAATVNGTAIQRRAFEDELRLYADNTTWTSQQQTPVQGSGQGTVTMDFTDSLLRRKIALELIRQENQRRGVTITPDVQQQAEQLAPQFTLSLQDPVLTTAWNAFPESFRKQSVEETAQYLALSTALGGGTLDDAALQKIYDENPARFSQACIRHILVATEQEAKDLKAQLDNGADFSQLATAHSTDGSATDGGRLYTEGQACPVAATTYDGDFVDGAFSVPVGTVQRARAHAVRLAPRPGRQDHPCAVRPVQGRGPAVRLPALEQRAVQGPDGRGEGQDHGQPALRHVGPRRGPDRATWVGDEHDGDDGDHGVHRDHRDDGRRLS